MGDYKFKITINFDRIDDLVTEEKTCIYLLTEVKEDKTSDDKEKSIKEHKDNIHFSKDKIIISGSRTSEIVPSDKFYTVQSNYYRESVKALLYVYYKYGSFNLKAITFESEGETERVELIKPEMFSLTKQVQLDEQILDYLFEYSDKGDLIARVLIFMLSAQSEPKLQFDYYWRAVNAIYDFSFSEKKQENIRIEGMIDYIKEHSKDFNDSLQIAEKFINSDFNESRAYRMMGARIDYGNRDFWKELTSFNDMYVKKAYHHSSIVMLIKYFFNKMFVPNEEQIKEISKEKKELFDKYLNMKEELEKTEQNDDSFDLLRFTIWLIYYFRNKYFHGEMWPSNFLVENFSSKELDDFSTILKTLIGELLASLVMA